LPKPQEEHRHHQKTQTDGYGTGNRTTDGKKNRQQERTRETRKGTGTKTSKANKETHCQEENQHGATTTTTQWTACKDYRNATHHTTMHNIPPQSRDLKDHNGKIPFAHATHNGKKQASKQEPPKFFADLILLPRQKPARDNGQQAH
jgi:hypothetical protein